ATQTYYVPQKSKAGGWKRWAIAGLLGALAFGGLAYYWRQQSTTPTAEITPPSAKPEPPGLSFADLKAGQSLEIQPSEQADATAPVLMKIWVQDQPPAPDQGDATEELSLPAKKLIAVLGTQRSETDAISLADLQWVKVRICPSPVSAPAGAETVPDPADLSAQESSRDPEPTPLTTPSPSSTTGPAPGVPKQVEGAVTGPDKIVVGWISANDLLPQVVRSTVAAPVCGSAAKAGETPSGNATLR
ncbi:MAG: hypothetical protein WA902_02480, partial [Thermosynechococcaceae cyanobacterium]